MHPGGLGGHAAIGPGTMGSAVRCGGLSLRATCRVGDRWQRRGRGTGGCSGVCRSGPDGPEAPGLQGGVRFGKWPGRTATLPLM